ncbi:hypothetical protein [Streptomyces iranensis]|uniref:hypothetical protein n=1 Tax=Streptomyces iranensis TaxID=576784 RepID=UPI0039B78740
MKLPSEVTGGEYFARVGRRPACSSARFPFHVPTVFLTGHGRHAVRHGGPGTALRPPQRPDGIWNLSPEDDRRAIEVLSDLLDEFASGRGAAQG